MGNVIIEHGVVVGGRKAGLRLTSESPWGAPAILFSPASMALSDATVGPSVNSPPRGMTSEIEIWTEVFIIKVDIVLVEVGVCVDICNKSQTRCCYEGMRSCHNGMNLIRQPDPCMRIRV